MNVDEILSAFQNTNKAYIRGLKWRLIFRGRNVSLENIPVSSFSQKLRTKSAFLNFLEHANIAQNILLNPK